MVLLCTLCANLSQQIAFRKLQTNFSGVQMKLIIRLLALAISAMAITYTVNAAPAPSGSSKTSIELCKSNQPEGYEFALCAASTCTPTGKRIAVNTPRGGKRWFRESVCTCPVLNTNDTGPAIANVTGGNMQGSCARPNVATVWSLYSPVSPFPQETAGWQSVTAYPHTCSASLNQGREYANCFSFKCDNIRTQAVDGGGTIKVADCHCPLGEDVFSALPAAPATSFVTDAGGAASDGTEATAEAQQAACYDHPVGGF